MGDDVSSLRVKHVKALRKAAKACGFKSEDLVGDNAGRERVRAFAKLVAESDGGVEDKVPAAHT